MNRGTYKNATKLQVGNLEFEVNHKNKEIFNLGRSKEARKQLLKKFIYAKLHERWMTVSKTLALIEKKFVNDLIDSI